MEAEKLASKVKDGSEQAFEELVLIYKPLIESMSEKYCDILRGNDHYDGAETLKDVRQEARLALYRAAMSYETRDGSVSFGLYAKICIRNALVTLVRKANRGGGKSLKKSDGNDIHKGSDPLIKIIGDEKYSLFVNRIEKELSIYEKTVFQRMVEGDSPREIAKLLSRDVKSVNNTVYRIKCKIKKILQEK